MDKPVKSVTHDAWSLLR